MTRFYLTLVTGTDVIADEDGMDLPSLDAARVAAIDGLRDVLAGDLRQGRLNPAASITIEDSQHKRVDVVSFMDAVDLSSPRVRRP